MNQTEKKEPAEEVQKKEALVENEVEEKKTVEKKTSPEKEEAVAGEKVEETVEEKVEEGKEETKMEEVKKEVRSFGTDQILRDIENSYIPDKKLPVFSSGDTIKVYYKTNDKVQAFEGVVIQIKGSGRRKTVTVRKYSFGVGVEKIFPLYSPNLEKIEVNKRGKVRRARIYYMRERRGKKARIKELRTK